MADADVNTSGATLVEQIARLERRVAVPQTGEQIHYVVVPKDSEIRSLKELQYPHGLPPSRIVQQVDLHDWESFCGYINKFKELGTAIFGVPDTKRFHAVLDYHVSTEDAGVSPDFADHHAHFQMKHSTEWNTWMEKNGKPFTQVEFAEFIEDNYRDIHRPAAAEMMQIARTLKATSEVAFNSKVNLVDGSAQFTYVENIQAQTNGELEIPETFEIKIPVFYGEGKQIISARLRYRIQSQKLTFLYKLYRTSEIVEEAFLKTATAIGNECEIKVLLGDQRR